MQTVTSHDGTPIAYDQVGHGPALLLVSGALGKRGDPTLANLLARRQQCPPATRPGTGIWSGLQTT